jgi:ABC-type transport system substrate-binding protein
MLDTWESGVRITGNRNPNYHAEGQPFFDRFEMEIGVDPSVGVLRMEAGEADIALDLVVSADYPRLAADPALSQRLLSSGGFPNTDYVILNNNKEPFSKGEVRRALSMAIDRQRLVQIMNGSAVELAGFLPPGVPGDNAELQPDAYDPEGAKQLLVDAGYPDGFSTTMLSNTDPINLSLSQAIIADLAAIGVQIELTSLDNAQFLDVLISKPDSLDMVMTNWYMDYQDPSNNWEPLLMCNGSYNWAKYCSEELDTHFREINLIPFGEARWQAFAEFEAMVAEQMPNIPLIHRVIYYFTSARLNIQADPAVLLKFAEATLK